MGWISRLIWLRLVPLLDEVGLEIDKEVWSGGLSLSLSLAEQVPAVLANLLLQTNSQTFFSGEKVSSAEIWTAEHSYG